MARVRVAALVAALMIGVSTAAVAQDASGAQQRQDRGEGRMKAGKGRMHRALFRGITLSDAQKSRLETIRSSYRTRFQAMRDEFRPSMQAMRDARQKNDTAAIRTARAQLEQHRERMRALTDQERAEVRGVLTAEQRVAFDRNVAEVRDRMSKRAEHRREHGRRGHRRGGERDSTGANRGA
jgi:Spy/CpxP family protein refolding chaperone